MPSAFILRITWEICRKKAYFNHDIASRVSARHIESRTCEFRCRAQSKERLYLGDGGVGNRKMDLKRRRKSIQSMAGEPQRLVSTGEFDIL